MNKIKTEKDMFTDLEDQQFEAEKNFITLRHETAEKQSQKVLEKLEFVPNHVSSGEMRAVNY